MEEERRREEEEAEAEEEDEEEEEDDARNHRDNNFLIGSVEEKSESRKREETRPEVEEEAEEEEGKEKGEKKEKKKKDREAKMKRSCALFWCRSYLNHPLALIELSRISIRRHLGFSLAEGKCHPEWEAFPPRLKNFIFLETEEIC